MIHNTYTAITASEKLNITIGKFYHLISKMDVDNTSDNNAYTCEQLLQLKIWLISIKIKLSKVDIDNLILLASELRYNSNLWLIKYTDTIKQSLICTDNEVSKLTNELKKLNTTITIKQIYQPN